MTANSPETMRCALFAGSFDPFTIGHASIVERGLALFDRVVIAVGVNAAKSGAAAADERLEAICSLYADNPRVEAITYSGSLTVDIAAAHGCRWLLRGVRSVRDFEYERDLADLNRRISGIETVILFALPEHGAVSSSAVRELRSYGHDITPFLPQPHTTIKEK